MSTWFVQIFNKYLANQTNLQKIFCTNFMDHKVQLHRSILFTRLLHAETHLGPDGTRLEHDQQPHRIAQFPPISSNFHIQSNVSKCIYAFGNSSIWHNYWNINASKNAVLPRYTNIIFTLFPFLDVTQNLWTILLHRVLPMLSVLYTSAQDIMLPKLCNL